MTLNLWHLSQALPQRLEAAAEHIIDRAPHVVCIQESLWPAEGRNGLAADSASQLADLCGLRVAISAPTYPLENGARSGLAVLTSLPAGAARSALLPILRPGPDGTSRSTGAALSWMSTPAGRPLLVVSVHLTWGARREADRLAEVAAIEDMVSVELASNPHVVDPLVVLGGDFNAVPDADSMRFLTGRGVYQGRGAFWVDAWHATHPTAADPGFTHSPTNAWAGVTAKRLGLEGTMLPHRRIDYVMLRDWTYGRAGAPLSARLAFTEPGPLGTAEPVLASDHFGVEVDLWDPPVPR